MSELEHAEPRAVSRRQWIAATATAVAGGVAVNALGIEPRRVTVTRHRVGALTGRTVGIAQLTDLHLRALGSHEERIAEAVAELRPQLIVVTGDAIDRAGNVSLLDGFLRLLPPEVPKLAILGNWEHWGGVDVGQLRRTYARANGRLLRNESVALPLGGADFLVTGLDDLVGGRPDVRAALRGARPSPTHLLLAHCPAHREDFLQDARAERTIDRAVLAPQLQLSGHTHGGQIAPFGWAPFRPPGSGRYVAGWYRDAAIPMYVSRGLGTSVVPARLGAPPEVAHFEWCAAVP